MTDNDSADLALTVYAPAEPAEPDGPSPEEGGDPGSAAQGIALAAERDRLARALRDTHRQLAAAEAKLMSVQRSATMELGQAIVAAAKRPWIGGPRLPRHLYRMWRERRAGRAAGVATDGFRSADEERWARILLDAGAGAAGDRFLAAYTVPGLAWSASARAEAQDMADGLVVAGVLTDAGCAALAPDATAEQLLPHDAAFVLEGSGADLVLIEAAALLPGGAWAHAGDPAATDRGRRLADLIDLARALGKPVIFLRNAPSYLMPYLDWLGTSCDAVVDGGLGVQLARFNPIDLPTARGAVPVYAGHRDLREGPAVKRLLDELTGAEPDTRQDNGRAVGGAGERSRGDAGERISERAGAGRRSRGSGPGRPGHRRTVVAGGAGRVPAARGVPGRDRGRSAGAARLRGTRGRARDRGHGGQRGHRGRGRRRGRPAARGRRRCGPPRPGRDQGDAASSCSRRTPPPPGSPSWAGWWTCPPAPYRAAGWPCSPGSGTRPTPGGWPSGCWGSGCARTRCGCGSRAICRWLTPRTRWRTPPASRSPAHWPRSPPRASSPAW